MKSINTLSIFVTLCLTLLITLILSSATVQAFELPQLQTEKVEPLNKVALNQQAMLSLANSMAALQLTNEATTVNSTKLLTKQAKLINATKKHNIAEATLIAE